MAERPRLQQPSAAPQPVARPPGRVAAGAMAGAVAAAVGATAGGVAAGATPAADAEGDAGAGVAAGVGPVVTGRLAGGAAAAPPPSPPVSTTMAVPPMSTSSPTSTPSSADARRHPSEPLRRTGSAAVGGSSGGGSTAVATPASRSRACAADGRSSGSTLNKRMRTPVNAPACRGGSGSPVATLCSNAYAFSSSPNGGSPSTAAYRVAPSAKTSDAALGCRPCATSGARYAGVPAITPVRVSCTSSTARETPKSVSFTNPSAAISTLPGFTSRCTTPARWAAASPSAIWRPMSAVSTAESGPSRVMRAASDSEGKYSMTSHGRSSWITTSNMLITWGWCSRAPIRPSRRMRRRDSSSSGPLSPVGTASSSFIATVRPSSSSAARHTTPMAPTPMRSSRR